MRNRSLAFLIWLFSLLNSELIHAQNLYERKIMVAKVHETCKYRSNGVCTIIEYCILRFTKDSVEVSNPIKAYCSINEDEENYESKINQITQKFKFTISDNQLKIIGFDDFEKLHFTEQNEAYLKSILNY